IDPQSYNNGAPVHLQLGNTGGNPASCTLSSNTMSDGAQAAPAEAQASGAQASGAMSGEEQTPDSESSIAQDGAAIVGNAMAGEAQADGAIVDDAMAGETQADGARGGDAMAGGAQASGAQADGELPSGLRLEVTADGSSCQISGTPTQTAATRVYTVTAVNAAGSHSVDIELVIIENAPILRVPPPLVGEVGIALFHTLLNSAEESITDCSAVSLPPGMRIELLTSSDSCRLIGTPSAVSPARIYTISATSSQARITLTISIQIMVREPQLNQAVFVVLSALEPASVSMRNIGGMPSQCTAAPALPEGLQLTVDTSNGNCLVTGQALTTRALTVYTITATNDGGQSQNTLALAVDPSPPALISPPPLTLTVGRLIEPVILANLGGAPAAGSCLSTLLPNSPPTQTASGASEPATDGARGQTADSASEAEMTGTTDGNTDAATTSIGGRGGSSSDASALDGSAGAAGATQGGMAQGAQGASEAEMTGTMDGNTDAATTSIE
ncbi:MAG: hypothetical protein K8963_07285, partial [Proteobacteria bacterium]|nr:hypothetical protein [Pseudomonadota bacterium]